jgi:uncharacterized membrane protein
MPQLIKWCLLLILFLVPKSADAMEKMECGGTEPFWSAGLTDGQATFELVGTAKRSYPRPIYEPAAGSSPDYVMGVRAKSRTSNLTAFVVNETLMVIAEKDGRAPPDREKYLAYCSDGMSELGYPFSIHLFVDGKAYTGCCSTAKTPPVGQR